ncbi:hypothetical protein TKK_0012433 [Trichogramma kaykai]
MVGRTSRNLYSQSKTSFTDNKTIGGRGRLTAKVNDQLSSYYTKAIRERKTVTEMFKAIWAILRHKRYSDNESDHELCPLGPSSWCDWQEAKSAGTLNTFHYNQ